jgi:hypothetical protein
MHRARRAQGHTRMVWRGGETTPCAVPVAVGARTDLPTAHAMAPPRRLQGAEGQSDHAMAQQLPQPGARSPRRPSVGSSTGKALRLTRGLLPPRSPSHPRRVVGDGTVPPLARTVGVTPHWG